MVSGSTIENPQAAFDRVISGPSVIVLLHLVKSSPSIARAIARVSHAWPHRLTSQELFGPSGLTAIANDRLLRSLLESIAIPDAGLERLLTTVRYTLLQTVMAATSDEGAADILPFSCALARQCFINEHVYSYTQVEFQHAQQLSRSLVGALRAGSAVPPIWPAVVAMYLPLHMLDIAQLLLDRVWPDAMQKLLAQQVSEPLAELPYRKSIPLLTPIDDDVSAAVRQQYEENPYPRWISTAPPTPPTTIDAHLSAEFPFVSFRKLGKTADIDILVSGCGTGRHAIEVARRFTGARVLAVDLSLRSLSYAKRKSQELGITNIEYAQADILHLRSMNRRFDLIEAIGVLHHLRKPTAGWGVLRSLLQPDGFMRLGLYSEMARTHITAVRALVAKRGYRATPDDIRRAREQLMTDTDIASVDRVIRIADFYSASGCRDLLFHVQEHQFTLPAIKAYLDQENLRFIGFKLVNRVKQQYRARFPEDVAMTDLNCWHVFETENPGTFIRLYQFWVQPASR